MNLQPVLKLIKRFRWHAIGASIVALWLVGYASLTFILPEEQTEQEGPVQPVEAKDLESQDVLSEVATEDEPQSFSSNQSNSGFNGVDMTQSQANKESNSRHVSNQCSAKKNSLKKWLERELAGEQKDYEQKESSILSNLVYSLLGMTDQLLAEARQLLEANIDALHSQYDQKLAATGC